MLYSITLNPEPGTWRYLFFLFPTTVAAAAVVYISTQRVLLKCRKFLKLEYTKGADGYKGRRHGALMHRKFLITLTKTRTKSKPKQRAMNNSIADSRVTMKETLENRFGFETFMRVECDISFGALISANRLSALLDQHLTKEWSGENLLFLVETVQFQQELQRTLVSSSQHKLDGDVQLQLSNMIDEESSDNKMFDGTIRLPSNVPESDIVFSQNNQIGTDESNCSTQADFREKATRLFEKYIANDAPFLINVSHRMKQRIKDKLAECEKQRSGSSAAQLLSIFDAPLSEIWIMMSGSFQRFQKTDAYAALDKQLQTTRNARKDRISLTGSQKTSITGSIKNVLMPIAALKVRAPSLLGSRAKSMERKSTGNLFDSENINTSEEIE